MFNGTPSVDSVRSDQGLCLQTAGSAEEARSLRREIVQALHASGGGHYGGSLSVLDILLTLYRGVLRVQPHAPREPLRDRLILSKGHAAIALYVVLRRLGFHREQLANYAQFASPLEGHPDMHALPGIDFSSGSLGQGLSIGSGMALALRERGPRVWVVLGDGECQEGQNWEAARLAAHLCLHNLHAIVDSNRFQECSRVVATGAARANDLGEQWRAFGWRVFQADGHDHAALRQRYHELLRVSDGPSVLIAHTQKGRGAPTLEADPLRYHCATLSAAEYARVMEEL